MLYERFPDEHTFQKDFVLPLLNRLGFLGVTLTHGQQEFGKDFVFAEITRLGFMKYHAAQVKHSERITQTQHTVLDGLLGQIKQAFAVPFRTPDSPRDKFVSSVYIFNSGAITTNAQEYLLESLTREHFGDNVHLFDGGRLESVNQFAAYGLERDIQLKLGGLHTQLQLNLTVWRSVLEDLPSFIEARGSIFSAIEAFLSQPIARELISYEDVSLVWQSARIIDAMCMRYRTNLGIEAKVREQDANTLRQLMDKAIPIAERVQQSILRAMETFKPL
jgi:hypothetical protein